LQVGLEGTDAGRRHVAYTAEPPLKSEYFALTSKATSGNTCRAFARALTN